MTEFEFRLHEVKSSPMTFMPVFVLGGKYAEPAEEDTAFGGSRRTRYALNIAAVAPTAELFNADRAWVRSFWSDLVPRAVSIASYVNFMSEFEEDRIRASYGAEKWRGGHGEPAEYVRDNVKGPATVDGKRRAHGGPGCGP